MGSDFYWENNRQRCQSEAEEKMRLFVTRGGAQGAGQRGSLGSHVDDRSGGMA